jgi:hypothetical protein
VGHPQVYPQRSVQSKEWIVVEASFLEFIKESALRFVSNSLNSHIWIGRYTVFNPRSHYSITIDFYKVNWIVTDNLSKNRLPSKN